MRNSGLLVPSFTAGAVGIVAFPFTLGTVDSPLALRLVSLWPVAVLVLGLAFFFRPVVARPRLNLSLPRQLRRKRKGEEGQDGGQDEGQAQGVDS